MEIPTREIISAISRHIEANFIIWLNFIRNPMSVIGSLDLENPKTFFDCFRFVLFVYLLIFIIVIPEFAVFFSIDITNPVIVVVDFISIVIYMCLFAVVLHISSIIFLGHAKFSHTFLVASYFVAFWPIIQLTDYLLVWNPSFRQFLLSGQTLEPSDWLMVLGALVLFIVMGIFVVIKTAPVLRHLYGFGYFRAYTVSLVAHGITITIGSKFMIPILNGLKDIH
ncbi:MAG: hypothetical protein NTV43_18320 [Methylococcales bacterium]|nr:hypothetical protein [Methylococcales bacterium]